MSAAHGVPDSPFDVVAKTWCPYCTVEGPTHFAALALLLADACKAPGTRRARGRFAWVGVPCRRLG
ncbi:MAG: hypothetical protein ACREPF_00285 [Rhodanobacteraceae bacterium]